MEEYNLSQIGIKFKFIREKNNISQAKLSEKIKIHKSTISDIERSLKIPSTETVIKFCNYFKISTDYLLSMNDENMTSNQIYDLYLNKDLYICLDGFSPSQIRAFRCLIKELEINK